MPGRLQGTRRCARGRRGFVEACSADDIRQLPQWLRDGIPVARQAAERAGKRTHEPADGDPRCGGFRTLIRRMARGPGAEAVG
jgi:hypothetical protein